MNCIQTAGSRCQTSEPGALRVISRPERTVEPPNPRADAPQGGLAGRRGRPRAAPGLHSERVPKGGVQEHNRRSSPFILGLARSSCSRSVLGGLARNSRGATLPR